MEVTVSVLCTTYNHEEYISKAIESFLNQKASFNYEILIHDDASTDKTSDIIREYAFEYPKIIKTVYQKENQYSQGVRRIGDRYLKPLTRGKYIALCEGDDYWTDPYKLQKQIDILETMPNLSMCVHSTEIIDVNGNKTGGYLKPDNQGNNVYGCRDVILRPTQFHTSSKVFRKELMQNPPSWYFEAEGGHTSGLIYLASQGDIYYIDEPMSVWRKDTPGGWNQRRGTNSETLREVFVKQIAMLDGFNRYTEGKYENAVKQAITNYKVSILRLERNGLSLILNKKYRNYLHYKSLDERIKLFTLDLLPKPLILLLKRTKSKLFGKE